MGGTTSSAARAAPGAAAPVDAGAVHERRWKALAALSVVQLMLFLDDTVVNVALPSIRADLGYSQTGLAWVVNAYVLAFGGLLLLGGRLADLLGARRMFRAGGLLFVGASFVNALAPEAWVLVASRGVQGLGAALTAPAALALVAATFKEPAERTKALGLFASLAGIGAALGVVLSGVITDVVDWRWVFWINVPVGLAAIAAVSRLLPGGEPVRRDAADVPGAVAITGAMVLLVYTLLETDERGWLSAASLVGFAVAAGLLAAFVAIERSAPRPLVRLGFFLHRRRNAAVAVHYLTSAALFGVFFLLTLHMQVLLGYSPLEGGLAWLGFFAGLFPGFGMAPALVLRVGVRPVLVAGCAIAALGMALLANVDAGASYAGGILPGMAVLGLGLGLVYIPITVAAVYDADDREAGLAGGMLMTGHQIGGALGLAVLVAAASDRTEGLVAGGTPAALAQVDGMQLAFWIGAGLCVASALVAIALVGVLRPRSIPQHAVPISTD